MELKDRVAWLNLESSVLAEAIARDNPDFVALKFTLKRLIFEAKEAHAAVNFELNKQRFASVE
ncbi:MAG: hypothetical protein KJ630_24675 [Proteobacteria bacterium]|nr:hypothetical protein [Pseudomonadota bacterium]